MQKQIVLVFLFGLSLNIALAPLVDAATGTIEPRHAYAIGGLGLIILSLIIYLFDVVFRPERY
jgi:F subunit of K+-transporting ATPase (Potass_KdpF)